MELRQEVLTYYLDNFSSLSTIEQFHFATRTGAWLGLPEAAQQLKQLRSKIVPAPETHEAFTALFHKEVNTPVSHNINAASVRAPYFTKYAPLHGVELSLFKLHWLQNVYGLDVRQTLLEVINISELLEIEKALVQDPEVMRALSTYGVNFIYLLHIDILQDTAIPREFFYGLGKSYDTTDPEQLQLFIYFYTHCILCEAQFYTKTIDAKYMDMYRAMLQSLEDAIDTHFDDVHLDNKVEFLVCCQICDYSSRLTDRIEAECNQSISDEGTFIIDKINNRPQEHRKSFEKSEHRNVLFIMSGSSYKPHNIRVS